MSSHDDAPRRMASGEGPATATAETSAEAEGHADLESGSQGFGTPPATPIATLPPLSPHAGGVPVSPRTGEPVRRRSIVATQVAFWASALCAGIGYSWYWFQAMHKGQFHTASWVTGWLHPRPGGMWSLLLACGLAAVVAAMVALPCVTAYQAWTGHRFARTLSWWALGGSLLGVLFNWWAVAAIPCALVGVVLLRLGSSRDYFTEWDTLRTPAPQPELPTDVFYGPLPRFQ